MAVIAHPAPARRINPIRTVRHAFTLAGRAVLKIRHTPEQLLDVMMEVHAAAAAGDGRFEMPRWLHAYLAHPDED